MRRTLNYQAISFEVSENLSLVSLFSLLPFLLFSLLCFPSFFLSFFSFFYPFTHEIPLRAFREWSIAIKRNETARQRAGESELKPDEGRVDGLGEETRGTKTVGERWLEEETDSIEKGT